MASIALDTLWLSVAADLADSQSFDTMDGLTASMETRVEVRRYAAGRTRLVSKSGRPRQIRVSLPLLTRSQVIWLEENAGRLLLVRDPAGRKFYGTFSTPTFDERVWDATADTELTIVEISHSEAV